MKIIVGITSWSARIGTALATLESLLGQTRKADLVELNLDRQNFPMGRKNLPKEIVELEAKYRNLKICFQPKDMKVWQKSIPTIRRHAGEEYILVTCDDDNIYPETYLAEIEANMGDCEWLCAKDDSFTFGQFMAYKSTLLERMAPYLTDELISETMLDDHTIFHLMNKVGGIRGRRIASVCEDRNLGYSFRRFFVEGKPEDVRSGNFDYPYDQFVKEREILKRHGIVD